MHSVKSLRIQSYSGPYSVQMRVKIRTRITPNKETFHAVMRIIFFNHIEKMVQNCTFAFPLFLLS